jgi:hypothetical protein
MPTPAPTAESIKLLSLSQIAREIRTHWKVINFAAAPSLSAMACLSSVDENYEQDSGKSIVNYFLCNAQSFRGDVAKIIKKELRRRVK